jgi:hypothetical protein
MNKSKYYHKSKFDLYINQSKIHNSGLGVFTGSFIPEDSYIDDYYGKYITWLFSGEYYFFINDYLGIDAVEYPRCYMAMLNDASYKPLSKRKLQKFIEHNYKNNCKFIVDEQNNTVKVYSLCNINIGDELFISYGSDYWK